MSLRCARAGLSCLRIEPLRVSPLRASIPHVCALRLLSLPHAHSLLLLDLMREGGSPPSHTLRRPGDYKPPGPLPAPGPFREAGGRPARSASPSILTTKTPQRYAGDGMAMGNAGRRAKPLSWHLSCYLPTAKRPHHIILRTFGAGGGDRPCLK